MYESARRYNSDIVLFAFNKVHKIWPRCFSLIVPKIYKMQSGQISKTNALLFNTSFVTATWVGLYHRKLFEKITFPVGKTYEDNGTIHQLIYAANRFSYVDKALYYYRVHRPGSITSSPDMIRVNDYREMLSCKIHDLNSWGYKEFAQMYALRMIVIWGEKENGQKNLLVW